MALVDVKKVIDNRVRRKFKGQRDMLNVYYEERSQIRDYYAEKV